MTFSPDPHYGQSSGGNWSPAPPPEGSPPFPPAQYPQSPPYGHPYAQQQGNSPYAGGPPPPSSGGGAVKWLVIGCLGCSGLAVIAFVALIVLGMLGSGSPDSAATTTPGSATQVASDGGGEAAEPEDAASTEPPEAAAVEEPSADNYTGKFAETDRATLTVTKAERTTTLGDSLWEYSTDNEYFVLDIEYVNKSNEAHTVWASDITLVDSDGNEFSTNTDVSLAVETPIIIEDVNPGLTLRGTLVFEVPPGTQFTELRLQSAYGDGESLTIPFE